MVKHSREHPGPHNAQRGQALAEYSLILAFVAIGSVVILGALGLLFANNIAGLVEFLV